MAEEYFLKDLLAINPKVKRQRLYAWVSDGLIKPGIEAGGGTGNPNKYSRNNIYQIELFRRLIGLGLSRGLSSCLVSVDDIKNIPTPRDGALHLVFGIDGEEITEGGVLVPTGDANPHWKKLLPDIMNDSDTIISINLTRLVVYVDSMIKKAGF